MVFFTCGGCGTNIKKPQVEKHIYQCRNAGLLSCMDCNKDFRGDEYKAHTKCITELEKYSEVGFKQAANANKGEKKQESWVEIIRATLDANIKTLNPPSRNLLHALTKHDNVPRKKAKFLNFIRNISRNSDHATIENVWNLLETRWNLSKPPPPAPKQPEPTTNGKSDTNGVSAPAPKAVEEEQTQTNGNDNPDTASLNKREKKAERRKKQHKEEKKDKNADADDQVEENGEVEKKKRKRKRDADAEEEDNSAAVAAAYDEEAEFPVSADEPQKKKKKKHKEAQENGVAEADAEPNDSIPPAPSGKFNWETIITDILLKKSDNELSLKRLQKKVFAEYYAVVGDSKGTKSVDELSKIMNKKIKKNPLFVVAKDNVRLVSQ